MDNDDGQNSPSTYIGSPCRQPLSLMSDLNVNSESLNASAQADSFCWQKVDTSSISATRSEQDVSSRSYNPPVMPTCPPIYHRGYDNRYRPPFPPSPPPMFQTWQQLAHTYPIYPRYSAPLYYSAWPNNVYHYPYNSSYPSYPESESLQYPTLSGDQQDARKHCGGPREVCSEELDHWDRISSSQEYPEEQDQSSNEVRSGVVTGMEESDQDIVRPGDQSQNNDNQYKDHVKVAGFQRIDLAERSPSTICEDGSNMDDQDFFQDDVFSTLRSCSPDMYPFPDDLVIENRGQKDSCGDKHIDGHSNTCCPPSLPKRQKSSNSDLGPFSSPPSPNILSASTSCPTRIFAVNTYRRHTRDGDGKVRLEKVFREFNDARTFAADWIWWKYSKFEDRARGSELVDEIWTISTPDWWDDEKGMRFEVWIEKRDIE